MKAEKCQAVRENFSCFLGPQCTYDLTEVQWTIGPNTEKSIVFSGGKLKLLRQIVEEADDVQITLNEENATYLFYIAFGVHDVRF